MKKFLMVDTPSCFSAFLLFCFYCSKSMILFRDEVTFLFILDDLVCSYPAA